MVEADQREQHRRARAETAEATALIAEANNVDAAVFADGTVDAHAASRDLPFVASSWDEAARREALATRLQAVMPAAPDAVEARTVADALQGKPAAAAPATPAVTRRAPKARIAPSQMVERTVGR